MRKFVFIPKLPTAEAWEKRAFRDCYGEDSLFSALKAKDFGENLKGYIHFKEGIKSQYKDGTEGRTYDTRKWWELGYTSCANKCCFAPPNERLIHWKEEDGKEALTAIMKEYREICEANYAKHLAKPRPMPKFKRQSLPIKREWQEFKRIQGPGGFIEQYELIEDKSTILSIRFIDYGHFRIE